MTAWTSFPLLLTLLAAVLGRPQTYQRYPQYETQSSFAGTPGFSVGGAGTNLGSRFGGGTRVTSINSFSGGTANRGGFSQANTFGTSQFFQEQFQAIQNNFGRPSSSSAERPSSVNRGTSSSVNRETSSSNRTPSRGTSEDDD